MEVRILGPLDVVDDGEAVSLPGGKPRALLASLALAVGEAVSAERLIDELWGEDPPETASNALQVHVSQLRKALGADVVRRRGSGYELTIPREAVDLVRFERLVEAARAAEPAEAARLLREALALWRGDPETDRSRLEELRLSAVEDRIEADLALGRHADVVSELQAQIADQPLRERPRGQLMLALYRSGRQAEALDAYQDARRTLVDELGIEPGPGLQELERAILVQAPELAAPEAPVTRTALPAPATPLVGRTAELAAATSAVRDEDVRLLTFTGPGGIGKTRLALEAAHVLSLHFADGAAFVGLTTIADPALVGATIAQALELTPRAEATAEDALLEHVRARELLLVLDNFEQLVEAAPLLARLLEASPRLVLLVTSRALLRIGGEREFAVPPLDAAVELFRARAHSLADGDRNDATIREICERLERLPLAIELAAARVRLLPLPELLRRLESRLDVLTVGARDAPERQRTMRAAIDWSYRLLEPEEQVLFARLGVFVGGAALNAVESVCGDVATLDALGSLVDKSLLRQLGDEAPRFAMLETLREYAVEQLAAMGEGDALRHRHARYFLELVDSAEVPLTGLGQREWLERLEREHANLRAAIAFSHGTGDSATAVGLAAGLRRFWYVHGHAEEGLRVLETVIAESGNAPPLARNKALNGAAMLASERGDYVAARRFLEESLALARELDDPHRIGVAFSNLGNLALYEQRWQDARHLYQQALPLHRRVAADRDVAIALENMGIATVGAGEVDAGVALLEEAIELSQRSEAPREAATASTELAWVVLGRGELDRARELLELAHARDVRRFGGPSQDSRLPRGLRRHRVRRAGRRSGCAAARTGRRAARVRRRCAAAGPGPVRPADPGVRGRGARTRCVRRRLQGRSRDNRN